MTEFPMGEKYRDAHLSKLEFDVSVMEKLNAWVKSPKNILAFLGSQGIGKTYFCAAIYNHFNEKIKVFYMTEYDLFRDLRKTMSEKSEDYVEKIKRMAGYDGLWILDDLGTSQMTEWQKEVIFLFIDEIYKNNKRLVITSNLFLNDLGEVYSKRFKSRIGSVGNTLIESNGPDKRLLGY